MISFRRAVYQVHLWTGLALALYLLMLSVTGSALVYRLELNRSFATPAPRFEPGRTPLPPEAIADAARRAYPGWQVVHVGTRIRRHRPVTSVHLARGDASLERLFDPYTGADLGDAMSRAMYVLNWLSQLHDDLLLGETGRALNGYASALVVVLAVSGAFVWWPGWAARRRRQANTDPPVRTLSVRIHRSAGIWGVALVLVWAVSGVYFAFPERFDELAYAVSGDDFNGVGYRVLTWITYLHFGRFSAAAQIVWVVLGLLPAALVVTGVAVWWTRRFRRTATRRAAAARTTTGRWLNSRRGTWATAAALACALWAAYTWANYREEAFVQEFLETVAAGQYREAHAMWDGDDYTFDDFLADWGAGGRHVATGPTEVVDSTTFGAIVVVYVGTGARARVALAVDKETMLLSYAPGITYTTTATEQ